MLDAEPARDPLVDDRRVDVAVADDPRPALERRADHHARRARRAPTRTAPPRPTGSSRARAGRASRIASPSGVPPGSRVATTSSPLSRSQSASSAAWVVFPDPSGPSKVMNTRAPTIRRYARGGHRRRRLHRLEPRRRPRRARRRGARDRRPLASGKREYVNAAGDVRRARHPRAASTSRASTSCSTSPRRPTCRPRFAARPRRRRERRRHGPHPRGGAERRRAGRLHLDRRRDLRRVRHAGGRGRRRGARSRPTGSRSSAARSTSPAGTASTATSHVVARFANVFGPRQSPSLEGGVVSIFLERMRARRADDDLRRRAAGPRLRLRRRRRRRRCSRRRATTAASSTSGRGVATTVSTLHGRCAEVAGSDAEPAFEPARLGDVRRSVLDVSRARAGARLARPDAARRRPRAHLGLDDREREDSARAGERPGTVDAPLSRRTSCPPVAHARR